MCMFKWRGCFVISGILLGMIAILSGLVQLHNRTQLPSVDGHDLKYWVLLEDVYKQQDEQRIHADQALRKMGKRALPFLVQWMQYPSSDLRRKAQGTARKMEAWAVVNTIEDMRSEKEILGDNSTTALTVLGSTATPVLPEMLGILTNHPSTEMALRATAIITSIGTNALPSLFAATNDPSFSESKRWIFWAIEIIDSPPDQNTIQQP